MNEPVRYCPVCDKYYPKNKMLCSFCFRDVVFLNTWNSMGQQKKINWKFEHLPQVDISTLSEDSVKDMQAKATAFDAQYRKELAEEQERAKYVPRCPTCGCPDIEKISGTSKVVDAVVWGFWSKKAGKTFRCKNCGYEW